MSTNHRLRYSRYFDPKHPIDTAVVTNLKKLAGRFSSKFEHPVLVSHLSTTIRGLVFGLGRYDQVTEYAARYGEDEHEPPHVGQVRLEPPIGVGLRGDEPLQGRVELQQGDHSHPRSLEISKGL